MSYHLHSNKDRINSILAFILGLTLCENISIVFTVNNTGFSIATVYNAALFLYLFLSNFGKIREAHYCIPLSLKVYCILCVVSIIPGIVYFEASSVFVRFFVGIIELGLVIITVYNAIMLSNYKEKIFFGLLIGFIFNILISLMALTTFRSGSVFSLSTVFDHGGLFYVPKYHFRAQGLFLEPSHFLRFFASVFLLIIWYLTSLKKKLSVFKFVLLVFTLVVIVYTGSGSVVIALVTLVLFLLLSPKKGKIKFRSVLYLVIAIGIVSFLALKNKELVNSYVEEILSGSVITSSGNEYRYDSMRIYLRYLRTAPFGIGYNLTGTLRTAEGITQAAAFSEFIEMTLELGVLGMLVYSCSLLSVIVKLLKQKTNYSLALALSLMGIVALQIGTDYSPDCCIAVVLGLAIAQIGTRRKCVQ